MTVPRFTSTAVARRALLILVLMTPLSCFGGSLGLVAEVPLNGKDLSVEVGEAFDSYPTGTVFIFLISVATNCSVSTVIPEDRHASFVHNETEEQIALCFAGSDDPVFKITAGTSLSFYGLEYNLKAPLVAANERRADDVTVLSFEFFTFSTPSAPPASDPYLNHISGSLALIDVLFRDEPAGITRNVVSLAGDLAIYGSHVTMETGTPFVESFNIHTASMTWNESSFIYPLEDANEVFVVDGAAVFLNCSFVCQSSFQYFSMIGGHLILTNCFVDFSNGSFISGEGFVAVIDSVVSVKGSFLSLVGSAAVLTVQNSNFTVEENVGATFEVGGGVLAFIESVAVSYSGRGFVMAAWDCTCLEVVRLSVNVVTGEYQSAGVINATNVALVVVTDSNFNGSSGVAVRVHGHQSLYVDKTVFTDSINSDWPGVGADLDVGPCEPSDLECSAVIQLSTFRNCRSIAGPCSISVNGTGSSVLPTVKLFQNTFYTSIPSGPYYHMSSLGSLSDSYSNVESFFGSPATLSGNASCLVVVSPSMNFAEGTRYLTCSNGWYTIVADTLLNDCLVDVAAETVCTVQNFPVVIPHNVCFPTVSVSGGGAEEGRTSSSSSTSSSSEATTVPTTSISSSSTTTATNSTTTSTSSPTFTSTVTSSLTSTTSEGFSVSSSGVALNDVCSQAAGASCEECVSSTPSSSHSCVWCESSKTCRSWYRGCDVLEDGTLEEERESCSERLGLGASIGVVGGAVALGGNLAAGLFLAWRLMSRRTRKSVESNTQVATVSERMYAGISLNALEKVGTSGASETSGAQDLSDLQSQNFGVTTPPGLGIQVPSVKPPNFQAVAGLRSVGGWDDW